MGHVRALRHEDLAAVVDLWGRAFRPVAPPAPDALRAYFENVFFGNPWRDERLPSLVYEGGQGVTGFLGVMPRPMRFQQHPIRVAVCTQFMVDPGHRAGLAAFALLRRLFAGPQDLSFADGANQHSRRIWTTLGGDVALLQSLEWTRLFRPAGFVVDVLRRMRRWRFIHHGLSLACRAFDAGAARRDPFRVPTPTGVAEEATGEAWLGCVAQWSGHQALQPAYDDSLEWLLDHAEAKKRHGTLQRKIVHNAKGELVGWFLYYLKRGGESTVLQVRARPDSGALVLDHLFHDARAGGATAISGGVQPELLDAISASHCLISCHGLGVLVHSRRPELLAAIHRGDAFLSRLDGEWCLRFSDYRLGLPP